VLWHWLQANGQLDTSGTHVHGYELVFLVCTRGDVVESFLFCGMWQPLKCAVACVALLLSFPISVWVENCALGHIVAACLAPRPDVGGRAYYLSDFNENIVHIYHALAGTPPPRMCLPYWLLFSMVHVCMLLHLIVWALSAGRLSVLGPMMGLHDGALAAGLPGTVVATRARQKLGYRDYVTRERALECCRQPAAPLLGPNQVQEVVKQACGLR
jgi:hypothetical protein